MLVTLHTSGTMHHMTVIYGTHVVSHNILWWFFHFFKILISWVVRGVKGQNMAQNDKKFCPSHLVYQEPYMYDCHLCYTYVKWYCLQVVLSFFQNFDFLACYRGKRTKNGPKWQKRSACYTPYLRNHTSYDCHLWYTFVKW